jgi:hypothetical protein
LTRNDGKNIAKEKHCRKEKDSMYEEAVGKANNMQREKEKLKD